MCGLTGFWDFKANLSEATLQAQVAQMGKTLQARGPDGAGEWCEPSMGLAMAHRRLAIVDLSEAGHQPMHSTSGRSVLIYNGEIYNTAELRKTLEQQGCRFRGYSDTEVILEACERWGVHQACTQFIGMFAFAFFRKDSRQLFLVRDRLGIKPLYWGFNQDILFFGSQLKSFRVHPQFKATLDRHVLSRYFRFNYVAAPDAIFEGMHQLLPGMVLCIGQDKKPEQRRFWDFETVVRAGIQVTGKQSDTEYVEALDQLLRDAVKRRMVADVPLGAFLSGGIDSSLVLALMQAQSATPIRSFSIGFEESDYNEAPFAQKVAQHLGSEHQSFYLSSSQAMSIIPEIPHYFDEPFADVSQIPTFLVSQLARTQVTVSLSGDGGDESFSGYNRYLQGYSAWQNIAWMPAPLRTMAATLLQGVPVGFWNSLNGLGPCQRIAQLADKCGKIARLLKASDALAFYSLLMSYWDHPSSLLADPLAPSMDRPDHQPFFANTIPFRHPTEQMQFFDTLSYLSDDILTKVDRASMAVSLEARVPLLDHRVVEHAWRLPYHLKVREGQGKWILRQVLKRYVPEALVDRPKMGFGVPIDRWLRGPLRDWAEALLSVDRLKREGILNPLPIRKSWEAHLKGHHNNQYPLWGILMFQAWHEHYQAQH